jgi:outer membrane protein OmpA-like peptidoglycan-associated protein
MFRSASAAVLLLAIGQGSAGQVADAPVLDISAPVLDIQLPVSSLDGSYTDITGGGRQKIVVAADVLFAFNEATLTPAAKSRIGTAAQTLRAKAGGRQVAIDGYTDSKGSDSYNLRLSQQRADAVRQALEGLLKGAGITFAGQGRGEANPVSPNTKDGQDYPEGRAKNRRVEISF